MSICDYLRSSLSSLRSLLLTCHSHHMRIPVFRRFYPNKFLGRRQLRRCWRYRTLLSALIQSSLDDNTAKTLSKGPGSSMGPWGLLESWKIGVMTDFRLSLFGHSVGFKDLLIDFFFLHYGVHRQDWVIGLHLTLIKTIVETFVETFIEALVIALFVSFLHWGFMIYQ